MLHEVELLHFARHKFCLALEGVSASDAVKRVGPLNSLSWMVGHLANQERAYWLELAQGLEIHRALHARVGTGQPASTPPFDEMWAVWERITAQADVFLESLGLEDRRRVLVRGGRPAKYTTGSLLLRNIFHYWFHTGEAIGLRQALGHTGLPEFVAEMPEFFPNQGE